MEQKTTWMLLLAFGILSSLLLQDCGGENVDSHHLTTFRYVNETSHTIEIKEWRKKVEKTYKLEPLGELKFKLRLPKGPCSINGINQNDHYNTCTLSYSDSLRVIFDGSKSYLLKHPGLGGKRISVNILDFNNYASTNTPCDYKTCEHLAYRFTEKDYQYAK